MDSENQKQRCPAVIYIAGFFYILPLLVVYYVMAPVLIFSRSESLNLFIPCLLLTIFSLYCLFSRANILRLCAIFVPVLALVIYVLDRKFGVHDRFPAISSDDFVIIGSFIYALFTTPGALLLLTPWAKKWFLP